MIHHESEDDHDDCMDATSGLIHLTDDTDFITPSLTIIRGKKHEMEYDKEVFI